jgi:NAD(P)-dependent dehydrogenase (short-subunit alcohol dehydrogenase family)
MPKKWTANDIPVMNNQYVVITGANSGIGYEAAKNLAGKGAQVVLAIRDLKKGIDAEKRIRSTYPQAHVESMKLDLANLSSIHEFANTFLDKSQTLSVLINNAGIMAIPYSRTADGLETQFQTNHLGHFALTGLLLPALMKTHKARVVTVSSINHNFGSIHMDDLSLTKNYTPFKAYNQSKLANLLFAYELQRHFEAANVEMISVGCHPGYSATNLQLAGPRLSGSHLMEIFWRLMNKIAAQSAEMGALPILYAAFAPDVRGGDYIGPMSMGGGRGYPGKQPSSKASYDLISARRLWDVSVDLTGVNYQALG